MVVNSTTATTTPVTPSTWTAWSRALGYDQGQLRAAPGAVLTVAAQGPLDAVGRLVHEDDPAAQLALALANVEAVLAAAGMRPADLAQLRVYTTDMDTLLGVWDTAVERFAEVGASPPTTLLGVRELPVPGMTVSIEAIALR
ncbi:enamine deaminase RidA (YjgF/YER057c/UK114 family) [Phycicoccus sp. SLBN-51]|nr:enamine deaminase RidA (YjgF/YER057c/UK114 family) [Phycicoccus sp. SLBN-51]